MSTYVRTTGASVYGAEAKLVEIEVSVAREREGGRAIFRIVGLPDSALKEGRERIQGAVLHGGWPWPHGPITVNLAPAAARKEGPSLDLPIALAILASQGLVERGADLPGWLAMGELGLDGSVRGRGARSPRCSTAASRLGAP
jgi:magnesium chelatase family protein